MADLDPPTGFVPEKVADEEWDVKRVLTTFADGDAVEYHVSNLVTNEYFRTTDLDYVQSRITGKGE
jgi:hypothetical protein